MKEQPHFAGVEETKEDVKAQLPIRFVLSSGDYARVKINTTPGVGRDGEPVAAFTKVTQIIRTNDEEP